MNDDTALVDRMEAVWKSIDELCSSLDEAQWKTPTDCPGWSVQDNLSHLVGNEGMLMGRAAPEHSIPDDLPHIKNPMGQSNEVQVDYRRSWPGAKVLEEFREITAERIAQFRSWTDEQFDADSWTPVGPGKARDLLAIRIFDAWVHEQDMRRAVGRPGDLEGPVAEHAFGRVASAMGFVVGKKAGAPEGSTVVFDIKGGGTIALGVTGRAQVLSDVPADPTVRIAMDFETFSCLGNGRWDPARAQGRVTIDGDQALGRAILDQMSFMV